MATKFEIIELLDTYGSLLHDKQKLAMEYYYYDDLSLSEIAENIGVSRQGINDLIKRSVAFLEKLEAELKVIKTKKELVKNVESYKTATDEITKNKAFKNIEKIVKEG